MKLKKVEAFYMTGKSYDCGSKLGYMKANVEFGIRHPEFGDELKSYMLDLLKYSTALLRLLK